MALTKITKHVVQGSILVQYKYQDLADSSANATTGFTNFGSSLTITPKYNDSTLEVEMSAGMQRNDIGSDISYEIRLLVNGVQEHIQPNYFGGYTQGDNFQSQPHQANGSHVGHDYHHYQPHHNQGWRTVGTQYHQNARHSVRFTHDHRPGNTNAQTFQMQFRSTSAASQFNISVYSGFLVVKEISKGISA
jgi:hypothetical protein